MLQLIRSVKPTPAETQAETAPEASDPAVSAEAEERRPLEVPSPIFELSGLTLTDREKKKARTIGGRKRVVLGDVTMSLPAGRYAVLGDPNDRAAFIDLLMRRRYPAKGRLNVYTTLSYPIGRVRLFTIPVRGADAVRFFAKLYSFDEEEALAVLAEVLPQPRILSQRLDDAQNFERLSLSLGIATFLDVETYVFDGNVGDPQFPLGFMRFVAENLAIRTARRNIIVSTRQPQIACSLAVDSLVIERGNLFIVEGVDPSKVKTAPAATEPEQEEERDDEEADGLF